MIPLKLTPLEKIAFPLLEYVGMLHVDTSLTKLFKSINILPVYQLPLALLNIEPLVDKFYHNNYPLTIFVTAFYLFKHLTVLNVSVEY